MDRMKGILIGYGYWGQILAGYIRQSGYFELAGVCDPGLAGSQDMEAMLEGAMAECAFVCVPISAHYDVVSALLGHGLHVFCEKPLCRGMHGAMGLYGKARQEKCVLFTDYIYTASPSVQYIKEHIGMLGGIKYMDMSIRQFGRFYRDDSVYEVIGVHMFSAMIFLLGAEGKDITVTQVHTAIRDERGNAEAGTVFLEVGGIRGKAECSLVSDKKERRIEVHCQNGMLVFDMLGRFTARVISYKKDGTQKKQQVLREKQFDEKNNLRYMLDGFRDAVLHGNSMNESLSLQVMLVLEQIKYFEGKASPFSQGSGAVKIADKEGV